MYGFFVYDDDRSARCCEQIEYLRQSFNQHLNSAFSAQKLGGSLLPKKPPKLSAHYETSKRLRSDQANPIFRNIGDSPTVRNQRAIEKRT